MTLQFRFKTQSGWGSWRDILLNEPIPSTNTIDLEFREKSDPAWWNYSVGSVIDIGGTILFRVFPRMDMVNKYNVEFDDKGNYVPLWLCLGEDGILVRVLPTSETFEHDWLLVQSGIND